jgi:hypothetical protein
VIGEHYSRVLGRTTRDGEPIRGAKWARKVQYKSRKMSSGLRNSSARKRVARGLRLGCGGRVVGTPKTLFVLCKPLQGQAARRRAVLELMLDLVSGKKSVCKPFDERRVSTRPSCPKQMTTAPGSTSKPAWLGQGNNNVSAVSGNGTVAAGRCRTTFARKQNL